MEQNQNVAPNATQGPGEAPSSADSGPWKEYQAYQEYQRYQAQAQAAPAAPSTPEPDMGPWKAYVQKNLEGYQQNQGDAAAPGAPGAQPRYAESFLDAFEAGMQMSVSGLVGRQQLPDKVLPENAGAAMRLLSNAGQLVGDAPMMLAGGAIGGAAGTEVPVVGNVVGAGAGAFALPAAMRRYYMDLFKKGQVASFGDFFERAAGTFWDAAKAATTGAAATATGGLAGGALADTGLPLLTQTAGKLAAELGVMTTVGSAMEGRVPQPNEFIDGALLLAGLHGSVGLASEMPPHARNIQDKLAEIYAQAGVRPADALVDATANPVLKQELVSSSTDLPKAYQPLIEKSQPNQELLAPRGPDMMAAKLPEGLGDTSHVFGKGFSPDEPAKIQAPESSPQPRSPTEPADLNDPKAAILDRIGTQPETEGMTWSKLYTKTLDDLNPVRQLTKALAGDKSVDVANDPYKLFRLARGSYGTAEAVVDHGPLDFATKDKTGAPGLKEILAPFKGDLDGFKAYMIGARAIELESQGVQTGVPLHKAKEYVEANQTKYDDGAKKVVAFQNDVLKYLRDSGVVPDSVYRESLENHEYYIPFNRVQEEQSGSAGKSAANPVKAIYGSSLKLADPVEQLIRNTFAYTRIAERNRAATALVKLGQQNPDVASELLQKVPQTTAPVEVKPEELAAHLAQYGIHEGDPEALQVFRPLAQPLAKDEIAVMADGKRQVYKVGEDVAKAINGTDYQLPSVLKVAAIPAKMIRTGAVETPDFLLRHLIRDQVNAFVLSNNSYTPFLDAIRGMKSYFSEDATYQKFLASGGGMSNIVSLDRDYIQNKVFELSKETGLVDKTMNVLKNPLQIMQAAAEAITTAPRLGEFSKAQAAGKDIFESGYDARNVTIDNQRMGQAGSIHALSMITAFWNTHLQGMDRMVQALADDTTRARTATRLALGVTLPSVLLWYANKDDSRYQDLPRWEKDLFWIFLTKDNVYRIPKPFEPGIVSGSLPERMLQASYEKDPNAFKGFGSALLDGAIPNPIPNALTPAIEQFANRSFLTGGNIVPHSLENVAPAYQYNAYTSETGKLLGKMVSYIPGLRDVGSKNVTLASPMVIQNYVRAWGGSLGQYALSIADKALETAGITSPPPKPASSLEDYPVIKAFMVRYPSANSQAIQDFYENLQKTQTVHDTVQRLAKSGDYKSLSSYMGSPEAKENMVNLMGMEKALSAQARMLQLIEANPQMKPDEKRQQMDGLYNQMIQIAQTGNRTLREVQESREKNPH